MRKILVPQLLVIMLFYTGLANAFEVGPIDIHGYISQGYLKTSSNDYLAKSEKGTYEYNEAGINFSTVPITNLQLGVQLTARDLGDSGNNEFDLDWGFADYRFCNEIGLRLGKLKVPFGLYNDGRDLDMLRTNVILPQSVYFEFMRPFWNAIEGGGIYGTVGPLGCIEYTSVLGSTSTEFDNTVFNKAVGMMLLNADDIDTAEMTVKYSNSNRVIWNTPLEGLRLAATQAYAKAVIEPDYILKMSVPPYPGAPYSVVVTQVYPYSELVRMRMSVFSGEYKYKNLTLAGEYSFTNMTIDYDPPSVFGIAPFSAHQKWLGYYGSVAYRFFDWLEIGAYRSIYYPDSSDKDGSEQSALTGRPDYMFWQHESCLTLRFDINPCWLIKLEGHHINGAAHVFDYANVNDVKRVWSLYAFKTTFSF